MFLIRYGSLDLYDKYLEKRFVIDHKQLQFYKNADWFLFVNCNKPDGSLSGHDTFCIHGVIFDRIQSNCHSKDIMLKFISNEPNKK